MELNRWMRVLAATLAAAATCVVTGNGLIYPAYLPAVQVGVLGGLAAALIAETPLLAMAAGGVGSVAAFAVGLVGVRSDLGSMATVVVVAVLVAGAARFALARKLVRESLVLAIALLIIVADVWLTGTAFTSAPYFAGGRSEAQIIAERPASWQGTGDSGFYRDVVWRMRDGAGYYQAYSAAWPDFWNDRPTNAFQVREPLLFEVWSRTPGWPLSGLTLLLALTSAAVLAAPFVLPRAVPSGFGVFGAAALAAYVLGYAFAPAMLFLSEPWAGALAVIVVALVGVAHRSAHRRALIVTAALLAVVAVSMRELMVFLLAAGLVGAAFAERENRGFELVTWGAACAAILAIWGAHWWSARAVLSSTSVSASHWLQQHAGLLNLYHGVIDQTDLISPHVWVAIALVVLGVIGAAMQPDRGYRGFVLVAVVAPYVAFLFVSNDARSAVGGGILNYWGAIVTPLALAMSPAGLALLPGVRARDERELAQLAQLAQAQD